MEPYGFLYIAWQSVQSKTEDALADKNTAGEKQNKTTFFKP